MLLEIGRQLAHVVQALFNEQQGAGHLEPEPLTAIPGVAGRLRKRLQQLRQRGCAQLLPGDGQGRQLLAEAGLARRVGLQRQLVPVGLCARQRLPGFLQGARIDPAVAALGIVGRHRVLQAEGLAQHDGFALPGRRGGDEEQRIAQHRLRQLGLALRQAAQLQIDLAEQLFDVQVARQRAVGDQPRHAAQRGPGGARPRIELRIGQRGNRLEQGLRIGALGGRVRAFQVRQQRFFETCAAARVIGRGAARRLRQPERDVRVEGQQVRRVNALGAEEFLQRAVIREQAQRLRREPGDQFVEVFDDGAVGLAHRFCALRRAGQAAFLEALERAFGGGGQQPHPFHIHHLQRAVRLVQVGLRMQQQGRLGFGRTGGGVVQGAAGTLERAANLADHPGQGTCIKSARVRGWGHGVCFCRTQAATRKRDTEFFSSWASSAS